MKALLTSILFVLASSAHASDYCAGTAQSVAVAAVESATYAKVAADKVSTDIIEKGSIYKVTADSFVYLVVIDAIHPVEGTCTVKSVSLVTAE